MRFGTYRFNCRFLEPGVLPAYKGSTLRGLFGHSLKKVVCALRKIGCLDCLLSRNCVYTFFFEPGVQGGGGDDSHGLPRRANPYVIEPPLTLQREYEQGDVFSFNILLFGSANEYLPYLVYAIRCMGEIGLGKKQAGRRAAFRLEEVFLGDQPIYSMDDDALHIGDVDEITPDMFVRNCREEVTVRFMTPFRVKFKNSFSNDIPFHILIRAALRRISALEFQFGQGRPALD